MSKKYWQVAAGSSGRDYTKDFLRYGMAFVGGEETMAETEANDRIILKNGMSEITAVGKIVEREGKSNGYQDKVWLKDFDGWNLSSYCYVEWHVPKKPIKTHGLTRSMFQAVHQSHLKSLTEKIMEEVPYKKNIESEPPPTRNVKDKEILEFLIQEGLRPAAAEDLTAAFRRIRLLAKYYWNECKWEDIREHETRTFLILPLLLALGWAEQQIKIELGVENRKRVDIACFSRPYRRDDNDDDNNKDCALILESKGFSQGLDYAPDQAKEYAEHFPNCQVIVVSNGYCYKAYIRGKDSEFQLKPYAYLNLLQPQDQYPLDPKNVKGSLDLLRYLLPTSVIHLMQGSKI